MEERIIYQKDFYGDPVSAKNGVVTGGLYFYLLTDKKVKAAQSKNQLLVPPTETVVNVSFFPYLEGENEVLVHPTLFDTVRYPLPDALKLDSKVLYRIGEFPFSDKKLGTFKRYNIPTAAKTRGGVYDWRKEGKLYQYPFTKLELNDHVSTPLEIKPHLYNSSTNSQAINVRHALNHMGLYLLYSPGYKADSTGLVDGTLTSGLNIPTTSSFYMDMMAKSQESLKASRVTGALTMGASAVSTAAVGAKFGSAAGPWGTAAGAVVGGLVGAVTGSSGLRSNLAQERDAEQTPASMRNSGGDVLFNMQISDLKLYAYRLQYPAEVMERIGWFFHLYGYKQNRVMLPNLRSRYYYNYIKTENVNLKSEGIPKEHLIKLRTIYDNGLTIWHADRSGVSVGDYSRDNYEI